MTKRKKDKISYTDNLRSDCCNADIKVSMSADFIGDNPDIMRIGTCSYYCTKCNEACNVHVNKRKTWKINPAPRIIEDKREKKTQKLTKREIKKILQEEDF